MIRLRIHHRGRLALLACLAGLALPVLAAGASGAAASRPNIVVFVADDMGFVDAGSYGCRDIPTPNLDAMAKKGVRFTDAYTSGCVCSPSRAGLLTGRYQQRFGFDANAEGGPAPTDRGPRALDREQVTFGQRMKALGYATGIFGKWHQGDLPGYRPTERGFDEFFGILPYGLAARPGGRPVQFYRGIQPVDTPADAMEAFAKEAAAFIDRHARTPFLLYLPFTAVHGPFVGPEPWAKRFDTLVPASRQKYAADLAQMDDIIGRVMAQLRSRGLEENTLVFFFSDNGGPGGAARNGPLKGTKWTLWEGGIHVPFIVQWPGRIPAGRVLRHPVIQVDVLPTAVAAAGGTILPEWKIDGANLLPVLEGRTETAPHDALYWRFGVQYAVRQGDWKLLKPHINSAPQLYNLARDLGETNDLAAAEPARVRQLQALWDAWNAGNETPRWIDVRWNGDGPAAAKAKRKAGAAKKN
jgi:arylsulfatase A-like enzyme